MDARYGMPSPRSYSREPSPGVGGVTMTYTRSHSRHRLSRGSSQERPIITTSESHRQRSYHAASPNPHLHAPPMGRSISVKEHRPSGMRLHSGSSQGITIPYSSESARPRPHSRALSSGSGFSYDDGRRRRPTSYYATSGWQDPRTSFEALEAAHYYSPRNSYDGRNAPVWGGAVTTTGLPAAPNPPISAYRADDDLARLAQAKLELDSLSQARDTERGRSGHREYEDYMEKQNAVALAYKEETDRAKAAMAIRRSSQPAVPKAPLPAQAKPLKPALKQTPSNDPAPPKNLNDYQAKVPKNLISRAALVEMGFPYEEHKDYLLVRRYLSKDDIKALLDRTEEIRKQRAEHEKYKAHQAAATAKAAEEASRPRVYSHTTSTGKSVQIVTVPQKPGEKEPEWKEEKRIWDAEVKARQAEKEKIAKAEADWLARKKENEARFKALEAKEEEQRKAAKIEKKDVKKGWFF